MNEITTNPIPPRNPYENDARFVRMTLVECFVVASTWSDMQKIGEALSKLNRIEKDMVAEWAFLHPGAAAAGQAQSLSAGEKP